MKLSLIHIWCNNEIAKLILGNTLTTESSEKGTQALGTVHKKVEDKVLDMTVDEIGVAAGMGDANYFSRMFRKVEGISPREYRKQW